VTEEPQAPFEPRSGVPEVIVDPRALQDYADRLATGSGPLALDAERASGYRYSQRAYLVQLRREGAGTALIDPIELPDLTAIQEATADVEWILHAATQDLPCLAELGLTPSALFDTELAGRLLGRERVSLAALVQSELGEVLEKGHGATDWSVRPLTAAQLRYAALDVELLPELRASMGRSLDEAGKSELAAEEFTALLTFTPRERGDDEWRRTSGIHRIRKPRDLAVVRSLWLTRDDIARSTDIAIGRILPDASIVAAAKADLTSIGDLADLKEFNGRGAHRYLRRWWTAISEARALPVTELPLAATPATGPPPPRSWPDRDPAAFARLSAARTSLSEIAEHLEMPVENLMTPDLVRRLCWTPPDPADAEAVTAYLRAGGAREWQITATLDALTRALAAVPEPTADTPAAVADTPEQIVTDE
jgi:ribonuclease D